MARFVAYVALAAVACAAALTAMPCAAAADASACEPGTYFSSDDDACVACAPAYISTTKGATACTRCPEGQTSPDGVTCIDYYFEPYTWGAEWLADTCSPAKLGEMCTTFAEKLKAIFKGMEEGATNFTIKFHNLDALMEKLGGAVGFPAEQLKYLLCMMLGYPLGFIYSKLRRDDKHLFSLAFGFFIAQFVFGTMWVHSFITSGFVYLFLLLTKNIAALDGTRHFIVLLFCMAYMSFSHIFRVVDSYLLWELDYTGPQMLLTIKLTSLAFNLHDGTSDKKRLDALVASIPKLPSNATKDEVRAHKRVNAKAFNAQDRLDHCVTELPTMLEYFGWVYCFQNFLAGPAIDLREYLDTSTGKSYGKSGKAIPSGRLGKVVQCFLISIVLLGLNVFGTANFPVENLHNPDIINASPWFKRLPVAWVTLFFVRQKYYFAWLMVEGSAVLSGFGYTPKSQDKWGGANNVDIISFETAGNIQEGTRSWNKFTQAWLERYVYRRTNGSLAATYFVSAFWHGFYPGYYLFFMSVPLVTNFARELFRKIRPRAHAAGLATPYHLFGIVMTSLAMNYLAASFQALAFDYALLSWGSWFFVGHIVMLVGYIVLLVTPGVRKADKPEAAAEKSTPAKTPAKDEPAAAANNDGAGSKPRRRSTRKTPRK